MPGTFLHPPSMDFQSVLDYVATVGYDVNFLRGKSLQLLDANPIAKDEGAEHFDPRCAPAGALAASGPWAARLLQGGGTFIDELAGSTKWHGSLDLVASARRVSELVRGWMEVEVPRESDLISQAGNKFPVGATTAEQFYSLRDAIHFSQQWLPGTPTSRPALMMLLAFCIGVDEFLCPVDSLDTTVFLGRKMGDLFNECVAECGHRDDAVRWLAQAQSALRSSVFLQNREKLAYLGLVEQDKQVFTDWDTTAHYMLRAEAAMTPFVGFCLCAYAGVPFQEDLIGAVGLYCYGNAFVLDFCKRSTRLGAGNFTEVALDTHTGELQGRGHLIGCLLSYGEDVLPPFVLCVLRAYVLATSSVVDVLDRYRERSWGQRLPVSQAMLQEMRIVLERTGGKLGDSPQTQAETSTNSKATTAEVIQAFDAWDAYNDFAAKPTADSFYRLPRPVRLALQPNEFGPCQPQTAGRGLSTEKSWLEYLSNAKPQPLPIPDAQLTKASLISSSTCLPPVRMIEPNGLGHMIVRSPARPGGHASGHREFVGRPVGSSPLVV